MPVTAQAYSSSEIMESLRLRLETVLEIDESFCRLVMSDDYEYTDEETLIAIRPLGPVPFTDAGGGRRARPVTRSVRVYIHKRNSSDFVGDDRLAMAILLDFEDSVFNALDDHFLRDADNTTNITLEPLHPTDASAGPPVRQPTNDVGRLFSRLDFEVKYMLVNNTPAP